jgi:signal transduction histidine kinase
MMLRIWRNPYAQAGLVFSTVAALAALAYPGWLGNLVQTDHFMPHATCYLRDPAIMLLHVASDTLIGVSYMTISVALMYLVQSKGREMQFQRLFLAFGLFIVTCGLTHFMEVWTVWQPVYWLAGYIKALCAAASVATAVALILSLSRIKAFISSARVSEERRSRLQEANQEMEAFVYSISHDLRSPLRAINGLTAVLEEDYGERLDAEAREHLKRIHASAIRMDDLIHDLLEYSQVSRKEFPLEQVSLATAIEEAKEVLAGEIQERGATIETPRELPSVRGNRTLLFQTFVNLLSNAIKYVAPGVKPVVQVTVASVGDKIRVTVADNGIGIEPRDTHKVFRIFERLHSASAYPGTGVGLAIVQKAILRMDGTIAMESTPGRGTSFVVELPAA